MYVFIMPGRQGAKIDAKKKRRKNTKSKENFTYGLCQFLNMLAVSLDFFVHVW